MDTVIFQATAGKGAKIRDCNFTMPTKGNRDWQDTGCKKGEVVQFSGNTVGERETKQQLEQILSCPFFPVHFVYWLESK